VEYDVRDEQCLLENRNVVWLHASHRMVSATFLAIRTYNTNHDKT